MKRKSLLLIIAVIGGLFVLSGCVKKEEAKPKEEDTRVASILTNQFKEEMKKSKDASEVAKKISENESIAVAVDVVELKKGDYVQGFDKEIKGYQKAYAIMPAISSIPFIAYIFEVDNAEDFAKYLNDNANLRWNVCTEADNKASAVVDKYVFFVMAPENFEE